MTGGGAGGQELNCVPHAAVSAFDMCLMELGEGCQVVSLACVVQTPLLGYDAGAMLHAVR